MVKFSNTIGIFGRSLHSIVSGMYDVGMHNVGMHNVPPVIFQHLS